MDYLREWCQGLINCYACQKSWQYNNCLQNPIKQRIDPNFMSWSSIGSKRPEYKRKIGYGVKQLDFIPNLKFLTSYFRINYKRQLCKDFFKKFYACLRNQSPELK